jgi:hypothetical protein
MEADMILEKKRKAQRQADLRWGVCGYLLDGPKTLEALNAIAQDVPCPFLPQPGFYRRGRWKARGLERLPADLDALVRASWVTHESGTFALTDQGRELFNQRMEHVRRTLAWVGGRAACYFRPEVASIVTLVVQALLALVKLPAGLLSGSVGLLNDSADTVLDLASSVLVYLGVRFNRERAVSVLLVVFMLGTGGFTLYQAVHRLFSPYVPHVDWFPFAAAILSAAAGLALWTYQRYVGLQSGLMPFITESVDSRNHVFVALSVTAGLAASLLNFGLLDMLVGLAVAVLILWSAVELALDLVHASAGSGPDLSRYGFWLDGLYHHVRNAHVREVMLDLIDHQAVQTKAELVDRTRQAFDYRNNEWMRLFGLDRQFAGDADIERALQGLVSDKGRLNF